MATSAQKYGNSGMYDTDSPKDLTLEEGLSEKALEELNLDDQPAEEMLEVEDDITYEEDLLDNYDEDDLAVAKCGCSSGSPSCTSPSRSSSCSARGTKKKVKISVLN